MLALRLGAAISADERARTPERRERTLDHVVPASADLARLQAPERGQEPPMPRFIKDDLTPRGDARDVRVDPEAVAERLRVEMRSAVGSLRVPLPEAFPRWRQRRRDAVHTASNRSE